MGMLLIILQIIGALPGIIEALKKIWEMIKEIKEPKLRSQMKQEHRAIVFGAMKKARNNKEKRMSSGDQEDLLSKVDTLSARVQLVLDNQGG